jgi:hypothetical protein
MTKKYINIFQSKIYPNWDFWFENEPSGNPAERNAQLYIGLHLYVKNHLSTYVPSYLIEKGVESMQALKKPGKQ